MRQIHGHFRSGISRITHPQIPLEQFAARVLGQRVGENHPLGGLETGHVLGAVRAIDPDIVRLAKSFNASRTQVFWKIEFPASLPPFFAGLRIAADARALLRSLLGGDRLVSRSELAKLALAADKTSTNVTRTRELESPAVVHIPAE